MANDPNLEWLGYVQPVGLVVAPSVLSENGLVPAEQSRADTDEFSALLTETGPAIADPWQIASEVLGWPVTQVSGAPGGPALPDDGLHVFVPEAETELSPDWAVLKPGGGWQLLVQRLPMGIEPDRRGALQGWEATPHQRLERLLRETRVQTGLLISDDSWRLIHAPNHETSGQITFPLRPMGMVSGRPMLGGFKLLLDRSRLFTDAPNKRLPAILTASREAQAAVSTALAGQVLGALHELLRGLHAADPDRLTRLAQQRPQEVYEGLLTVLLRLIFLLYAEDRDLIPSRGDATARALYHRNYGIRGLHARLRHDAARNPDTMNERYGAWGQLLATFKLVHSGDGSGWIRGRGGNLFDPGRFSFLQGQDNAGDRLAIPRISDGAILRVLDGLMVLNGERLSYRTLDVEQIGSVYETVMGFAVLPAPAPVLAIRAGKNNRTPIFVDLAALTSLRGKDRIKALKEEYSRGQISAVHSRSVEAATSTAQMAEALRPIVDERGSPGSAVVQPGTPILQPTDERRRTGSHYTPRSLTEPIVRHALAPAFERVGADATPDAVLALKVCDPAMGSGAFLVEACRQLATRLTAAWAQYPDQRPPIPADEDEDLLARRLVAQRCLYGVDRNPLATDLARLSLWLATLARDHEFTFLDHALKSGDSLVGLTIKQIGRLAWREGQSDFSPFDGFLRERVAEAVRARQEIQTAPDDVERVIQEQRHRHIEARMAEARLIGDAVLAAFFSENKPRAREIARQRLGVSASGQVDVYWPKFREAAATLAGGTYPIRPFHWPLEFPEVFAGERPGFDLIVGNPPFLGGTAISERNGMSYFQYLVMQFVSTRHHCDLVAYFFRRAFNLLAVGSCLGLVASNSIAQGDTREGGLLEIVRSGGVISRATKRYPWPGEAAVITSIVHILKGLVTEYAILDDRPVQRISSFLISGNVDDPPARLATSPYYSLGSKIYGQGFVFDDTDVKANPVSLMLELKSDRTSGGRIKPYIGGEDLNEVTMPVARRFVIDLNDILEEDGLDDVPALRNIIKDKVLPERMKLGSNPNNAPLKRHWWRYQAHRPDLYRIMKKSRYAMACSQVSKHLSFTIYDVGVLFAHTVVVIPINNFRIFECLQCRVHETWARFLSSTLEDRLRYTPSDCLANFPLPTMHEVNDDTYCEVSPYYNHRSTMMIERNEGLNQIYNRFHDAAERFPDLLSLRQLHHEMDQTILREYGWNDLADAATPEFLDETNENDHRYQGRLFWPSPFRDEVLARLLRLNADRAAEEQAAGISPLTTANTGDLELDS